MRGSFAWKFFLILIAATPLLAEPVAVRYVEGTVRGFLILRSLEGKTLASGDLIQVLKGGRVISHLVFRFKDGSVDDELAVFSQHNCFRLISDHHIQKGPSYSQPSDIFIRAETGQVTIRFNDKGHEKVETQHVDIPPDLTNGMILNVVKNIRPDAAETTLSYLAATPKPRLVKLVITPQGQESFRVAGARHSAMRFSAKIQLGGIEGIIAPLVGKEPPAIQVWVAQGEAPAFVRSQGPLYLGGPSWTIEMTGPVWPTTAQAGH